MLGVDAKGADCTSILNADIVNCVKGSCVVGEFLRSFSADLRILHRGIYLPRSQRDLRRAVMAATDFRYNRDIGFG